MARQNRVTPDGDLIAVPDRGLFWGNRGALHDRAGRVVRYSRGRAWAICVLEFKGRRRQLWAPGRLGLCCRTSCTDKEFLRLWSRFEVDSTVSSGCEPESWSKAPSTFWWKWA